MYVLWQYFQIKQFAKSQGKPHKKTLKLFYRVSRALFLTLSNEFEEQKRIPKIAEIFFWSAPCFSKIVCGAQCEVVLVLLIVFPYNWSLQFSQVTTAFAKGHSATHKTLQESNWTHTLQWIDFMVLLAPLYTDSWHTDILNTEYWICPCFSYFGLFLSQTQLCFVESYVKVFYNGV